MRLIQRIAFAAAFVSCAACAQRSVATSDQVTGNAATQQPAVEPAATQPQGTLEQRLARLCEQLEKQRQDLHIPGFAIAIVKDDEVILSKGFGVRDVEKNIPVTPETIFAIGSSSKAFTAALVAMMVDEGKMGWDDPARKHLPTLELFDKEVQEKITIRDLLSHRSGLERTDFLWASGEASRQEILAAIATAEPVSKLGEEFHYQNVMYLAAGIASANAAGLDGDWDALIAQRIFKPLGMSNSNTRIDDARKNPMLALGYSWNEDKQQFLHAPMRKLDTIAPAGAINSNVIDMVQWLRLQLNRGEVDGQRLISPERFDEMRTKQIDIDEGTGIGYGLGWMLRDWQGKKVVEHGGNIDGFGAAVTLVPEANLGYVLLTNVTATPLQSTSINLVCEALLGEWKETLEPPLDPTSVADYLGKYHLDVLKTDVTVQMKDGKLAVDVPGQMVFTLKQPDPAKGDGKWVFEITNTIAISFVKDDAGNVTGLNFYQGGLTMECPKEGVTLPVEIGLDEAQKYLGKYHDDEDNIDVTVVHRRGRLAVDVPNQLIFDLRPPDADGKRFFRATANIAVRFEEDASGKVTGMTHFQNGRENLLPRVEQAEDSEKIPTVDEALALHARGSSSGATAALGSGVRITGTVHMKNQGIDNIKFIAQCDAMKRYTQHEDMGKFGWITVGYDGTNGWADTSFSTGDTLGEDAGPLMRLQNPMLPVADWKAVFDHVEILRLDRMDEREVIVLQLGIGTARCTAFLDRENGRVLQIDYKIPAPGLGNVDSTQKLLDWRETNGVTFPMRWEIENDLYGTTIVELKSVESAVTFPVDAFALPIR